MRKQNNRTSLLLLILITLSSIQIRSENFVMGETWQANSVSVGEITFHFNMDYTIGMFANGDFWVLGPVTINSITPHFTGEHHGWQVNPTPGTIHAFDVRVSEDFDPGLVPTLPYTSNGTESIVKTVSRPPYSETLRPSLLFAAVLTVVDQIPPANGAEVFRPPYIGINKPYYRVEDIRRELIPPLKAEVPNTTTFQSVVTWFKNVQLDHILYGSGASRSRPLNNLPDYGSAIAQRTASAALRLMVEGDEVEYMEAMIAYLQCGIDYYHIVEKVGIWNRGSGEAPGHKLPIVFFVTLLGDELMKDNIRNLRFYEDYLVYYGADGFALWGDWGWGSEGTSPVSEKGYWNNLATGGGSRTHRDPYGYIDGGQIPGEYYQYCCTSLPFKGAALALLLMPELREVWNPLALFDYVDRWVAHGTWTKPDPCAAVGKPEDYGVTWGPDPENPGDCIKDGFGRFPQLHGTSTNSGYYGSGFHNSMWDAYRTTALGAEATPPFAAIIYPRNGDFVAGQVNLSATAFGINGVDEVQFKLNGNNMGEKVRKPSDSPPNTYEVTWDSNSYTGETALLSALVTDKKGNTFESASIEVIMDPEGSNQSGEFRFRVYPNPFSNYFNVAFIAPSEGRYSITLHDIKGAKTATLLDKELPQGFYSFDIEGIRLPAGVYICSLRSNSITESIKVVSTNSIKSN